VDLRFPHLCAHNRIVMLSSSDIREKLERGASVRYLVPEAVRSYIEAKGLYGSR
jgi:nicotinate-nucleotide adenylyltransferase